MTKPKLMFDAYDEEKLAEMVREHREYCAAMVRHMGMASMIDLGKKLSRDFEENRNNKEFTMAALEILASLGLMVALQEVAKAETTCPL